MPTRPRKKPLVGRVQAAPQGRVVGRPKVGLANPRRYITPQRPQPKPRSVTLSPTQPAPQTPQAPKVTQQPGFTPVASTMPAPTSTGKGTRVDAEANWANAQNAYRGSVFQNALQLGDPTVLAALKNDPEFGSLFGGVDISHPLAGSTSEKLDRGQTEDLRGVDESRNAIGSFFSGFRLKDRSDVDKGYADQRQAAIAAYQQAINDLANSKNQAYSDYQAALRQADQEDIDAAMAQQPLAQPIPEEDNSVEDTGDELAPQYPVPTGTPMTRQEQLQRTRAYLRTHGNLGGFGAARKPRRKR